MEQEDADALKVMCRRYGMYRVLKQITEQAREECKENYAFNPDAVIHLDTEIMENAIELMVDLHPIRGIRNVIPTAI